MSGQRGTRSIRAVIIEDDTFMAATLVARLNKLGVSTVCLGSVQEGTAYLNENPADFAIVDLGLPDGSGLDVVEAIRQCPSNGDIPIIVATANQDEQIAMDAYFKQGVMMVSHKPIAWSCLEYVLESTILNQDARQAV